mmetsp:Transcript_24542/g.45522  ORF Transcript_24542/g.45522 Transcript_24542/m.45522 type:complete len:94 (-) Transcript_24542:34-315(-)
MNADVSREVLMPSGLQSRRQLVHAPYGAAPPPPGSIITVESADDQAAAKAVLGTRICQALVKFSAALTTSMEVPAGWAVEDRRRATPGVLRRG